MAKVLLIEDESSQRLVASHTLRKAGHEVLEAENGADGLAMVGKYKPDLIVCDVVMPGMSGFQVLAALREEPSTSTVPVIMLTAMSGREHIRHGMTAGADDYLPKPYQPAELMQAVSAVLARRVAVEQASLARLKTRFVEALERQEQILSSRYEEQLAKELSSRWDSKLATEGQLQFEGAMLLVADLFTVLKSSTETMDAKMAGDILQSARDALYLFGAAQVVPYGEDILAVFATDKDDYQSPANARAARAAFALRTAVASALRKDASEPGLTVALHNGDFTLIRIQDPLHGDAGTAPVPGPALRFAAALRQYAKSQGWAVAATASVIDGLPVESGRPGAAGLLPDSANQFGAVAELLKG